MHVSVSQAQIICNKINNYLIKERCTTIQTVFKQNFASKTKKGRKTLTIICHEALKTFLIQKNPTSVN